MYKIFAKLLNEKGLSAYRVSKDTGVSQSVLSSWKNNGTSPRPLTLKILAEYLGVSVSYLKGETSDRGGKEKPAGDTGGREDAMQAFRDAAVELQEAVKKVNDGNIRASLGAEDVSVICPIDGTKQVIRQPYVELEGKRYAELNHGCGRAVTGPQCELCRMQAMLAVMRRGQALSSASTP